MSNELPITPADWQTLWSDTSVAFLKPFIRNLRYAFEERDHEAFLQLWRPGQNPRGSFISLGIRKPGKQKNGNKYSILFAFGFFYEDAYNWPACYIDILADRVVSEYTSFRFDGTLPGMHDDEVLKRNANVSAPAARKTTSHHGNRAIAAISPTKDKDCDVKKLDIKMTDARAAKQRAFWDELEAEEVDPLS